MVDGAEPVSVVALVLAARGLSDARFSELAAECVRVAFAEWAPMRAESRRTVSAVATFSARRQRLELWLLASDQVPSFVQPAFLWVLVSPGRIAGRRLWLVTIEPWLTVR